MYHYEVLQSDPQCGARRGVLTTAHGQVQTPAFMPVGTAGTVKGVLPGQLRRLGAEIILANTYHLMLRPGADVVEEIGGLHRFMGWSGPILTDSGGYQVFSLEALTRIDDKGVEFASHVDGTREYLDAERATRIQNQLGADVIMCFDQCPPHPVEPKALEDAVERTIRWAQRCKEAHTNDQQLLFGIIQGGVDLKLRAHCAEQIVRIGFDGYAIGGLSVGERHEQMIATVAAGTALLPAEAPRYLMGVGTPADIIAAVRHGVDMFDCVMPTRNGRNALAFTEDGRLRLRNNTHIRSTEPIEVGCDCSCCTGFTRGAIRHFFNCGEMLGPILLSLHNLRFYQRLMATIRERIESGDFAAWADRRLAKLRSRQPT